MVLEAKKSEQKEIVNSMVVRGGDGEWSCDRSKCSITSRMERYNDNYQKDAVVSMPCRRACTAFGDEDSDTDQAALDAARADNDTWEWGSRVPWWQSDKEWTE